MSDGLKMRGGLWHMDFYHEGQRVRESTGTADRKLAGLRLKEKQVALWKGAAVVGQAGVPASQRTVEGYFDRAWSIHFRKLKSASPLRGHFGQLLKFLPGSTPMVAVSEPLLAQVASRMLDAGAAPATVNRRLAVLSKMLRLAAAEHPPVIPRVPAIPFQREPHGRLRYLREGELAQLRAHLASGAVGQACRDEVAVLLDTGLRLGELLSLTAANVDLAARRLELWATKTGRRRWLPLTQAVTDVLAERLLGGGVLFPRHRRAVQRDFEAVTAALGWEDVSLHTLRHTYATRLIGGGADVRTVMALMGHDSIQTTMRYAQAMDSRIAAAVSILEGGMVALAEPTVPVPVPSPARS